MILNPGCFTGGLKKKKSLYLVSPPPTESESLWVGPGLKFCRSHVVWHWSPPSPHCPLLPGSAEPHWPSLTDRWCWKRSRAFAQAVPPQVSASRISFGKPVLLHPRSTLGLAEGTLCGDSHVPQSPGLCRRRMRSSVWL